MSTAHDITGNDTAPPGGGYFDTLRIAPIPLAAGSILLLVGVLISSVVSRHYDALFLREIEHQGPRLSLDSFPAQVGPYRRIATTGLSDEEFDMLRPSDTLLATYLAPTGRRFSITLLYWKPPRSKPSTRPDLLQRPHTPDECYPAAGWKRDWDFDTDAEYPWLPGEVGSARLYHRGNESQLLLFWLGLTFKRTLSFDQLVSRLRSMITSWTYAPAANIHTITIMTDATGNPEQALDASLEFSRTLAEILPEYGIGRRTAPAGN